ncbi:hypothetical protein F5883DRAFT_154939 [Diaporthe sp. PMI_573]|nr:hypothetical protein F5883DRAFT_154939 [Diaporthaceae sp. PMI_573]
MPRCHSSLHTTPMPRLCPERTATPMIVPMIPIPIFCLTRKAVTTPPFTPIVMHVTPLSFAFLIRNATTTPLTMTTSTSSHPNSKLHYLRRAICVEPSLSCRNESSLVIRGVSHKDRKDFAFGTKIAPLDYLPEVAQTKCNPPAEAFELPITSPCSCLDWHVSQTHCLIGRFCRNLDTDEFAAI